MDGERLMSTANNTDEPRVPRWVAALVLVSLFVLAGGLGFWLRGLWVVSPPTEAQIVNAEIERWTAEVDRNPDDITARLGLGYACQQAGELDRALDAYAAVLRRDPSNVTALFHQGEIYLRLGLDQDAETVLWKVLDAEPDHVQAAIALGHYYVEHSRFRDAISAVRPAAVAKPGSAELQYLMGYAYEHMGNLQWSKARYTMAIEASPDHVGAHEGLARLGVRLSGEAR